MKSKHKLTPFLFGLVLVSSLFVATFSPIQSIVAADYGDDAAGCVFTYSSDGTKIDRTGCTNDALGDLTYSTDEDDKKVFSQTSDEKKCTQKIKVSEAGDTSGELSGKYEKNNGSCVSFGAKTIAIGVSNDDGKQGCEGSSNISWIVCPVVEMLQSAVGSVYDKIIQPLLETKALDTTDVPGNKVLQAWKNFRLYGDIFIVIGLIVIVFGESIGGGLIDAYTAKKVLPRLLIAVVLLNLSFYIVAVLVDIMNVVGNGIMSLITGPFGLAGDFSIDLDGTAAAGFVGLLAAAGGYMYVSFAGQAASAIIFMIALPLLLIMLAILATVLIRQALIVFLVIVAPVAFALYCLPNTEKYFKQWWDTLFKTLLVYPIIASLFAMGKVAAFLLSQPGSGGIGGTITGSVGDLLAILAFMMPLLMIPFAFKIAGGIMGQAFGAIDGMRSRGHKFTEGSRKRISTQGGKNRIQARQSVYSGIQSQASKNRGFVGRNTIGRGLRGVNKVVGGHNIEAAASAARADTAKIMNDQIATGADAEVRGLTVNKKKSASRLADIVDEDGRVTGQKKQFQSLGGAWIDEADVDAGRSRWGRDTFAQQTALSYEMRKAQDEGQLQRLAMNYSDVAQGEGSWKMSDQQAGGAWIGASFERQGEHLEFKHSDWKTGQLSRTKGGEGTRLNSTTGQQEKVMNSGMRGSGLVEEAYQKKGSYTVAQMGANTIQQLKEAHMSASNVLSGVDDEGATVNYSKEQIMEAHLQQDKIKAISETFVHDMGSSSGITAMAGSNHDVPVVGPQVPVAPNTTGQTSAGAPGPVAGRMVSAPGAGAVNEKAFELAVMTGAINAQPNNPNGPGSRQKTQGP